MKMLQDENLRLKRLTVASTVDNAVLQDVFSKSGLFRPPRVQLHVG
jgi:hypothetical protein